MAPVAEELNHTQFEDTLVPANGVSASTGSNSRRRWLWPLASAAGIVLVGLAGFWSAYSVFYGKSSPDSLLPELEQIADSEPESEVRIQNSTLNNPEPISNSEPISDSEPATSEQITANATIQFAQNNLEAGEQAAKTLLDNDNLAYAEAALGTVPEEAIAHPAINFLKGRLAWQSLQQGNPNYSLDDARRFWETAVKGNAESAEYYNALGFAYYVEDQLGRATQAWIKAQSLSEDTQADLDGPLQPVNTTSSKRNFQETDSPGFDQALLTAHAGLALALVRSTADKSPEEQQKLLSKAGKLYQMVITSDPIHFQPQALEKNWLWPSSAIEEWRSLPQRAKL
ncbi:MAG: hypothetical protein F6K19_48085 [Cyanothece sp. SIO1E1]|nr:hypothetical protein [Cyanothece sp. SIO1E1]